MENIHDVLKMVERFSIPGYKDYCEKFVIEQLVELECSKYLKIMNEFSSYKMENLYLKCIKYFSYFLFS